jgi:hypothetical protein
MPCIRSNRTVPYNHGSRNRDRWSIAEIKTNSVDFSVSNNIFRPLQGAGTGRLYLCPAPRIRGFHPFPQVTRSFEKHVLDIVCKRIFISRCIVAKGR